MTTRSPYTILRKIYTKLKQKANEKTRPKLLDLANFGLALISLAVAIAAYNVSQVALSDARTASNLSASAAKQDTAIRNQGTEINKLASLVSQSAESLDQLTSEVQYLQSLVTSNTGQYRLAVANQKLRIRADSVRYISRLVFFEKDLNEAQLYFHTYQTKVAENMWVDSMRRLTTGMVETSYELMNNFYLIDHPILMRPVYSFYAKMSRLDDLLRIKEGVQSHAYDLLNQIHGSAELWMQNPNDTSQARQCAAWLDILKVN